MMIMDNDVDIFAEPKATDEARQASRTKRVYRKFVREVKRACCGLKCGTQQ